MAEGGGGLGYGLWRRATDDPNWTTGESSYGFNAHTLGNPSALASWASGQGAYNQAAKGAEKAAADSRAFAETQWGRAMEGMQGAQGAYGTSQDLWNRYYGNAGANRGPGAGEDWWANNGGKYNDPRATTGVLNQWQQQMGQPMQQTGAYNQYQQYMQQPSSTQGAYGYMQGQLQQPMQGQGAYDRNRMANAQPGSGEQWVASMQGAYRQPTNSQTFYNNFMGELGNAGRSEQFQVNPGQQDIYNQRANELYGSQTKPGYLDQNAGEIGSRFRGADDVAQYASRNLPQLESQGIYEQWAESAINGSNPMQDRIREKGLAQLNQEMARRGHFNSGGAGTAIGNYLAEQNAQEFAQKSELAKGAQGMQLQRLGQGQGLAEGSAGNKIGVGSALQGLYAQQDESKLGRDSLAAQIARDNAQQDLASQSLMMQGNRDADAAKLARLQGLSGMAGQADSTSLAQLNSGTDAAFRSQDAARNRGLDDFSQANQLDQTQLSRLIAQMQGAQQNDQTNMDRYKTQFGMAQGVDQSVMDRYGMLGNLAGQEDDGRLGYLNAQGNMAFQTQGANQTRIDSQNAERDRAFANQFGISEGLANTYSDFYGKGMDASGQAMTNSINANANAAQLRAQGQIANSPMQWAKTGADAYATYQTGGANKAVGAQRSGLAQAPPPPPPPGGDTPSNIPADDPSAMYTSYYQPPGAYDQMQAPMQAGQGLDLQQLLADGSGRSPEERDMLMDWYYQQMGLTSPNKRRPYGGSYG